MSEATWLTLLSILIGLLTTLVGWFWRQLADDRKKLAELGQFLGRDTEREKAWWDWRRWLESDRDRRHEEYNKRLDAHSDALREIEQEMARYIGRQNGHSGGYGRGRGGRGGNEDR